MAGRCGDRIRVGRRGEELAAVYLMDAGHIVLARNWRVGHLEIDIVTMARDGIHFVEVKSRIFPTEAEPEEYVSPAKQRKLAAAAVRWMTQNGQTDAEACFDVVSIVFKGETYELKYFPDAFIPVFM